MSNNFTHFLNKAAPTLLSILAGVGLVETVILAVKATPKAEKKIANEIQKRRFEEPNTGHIKPDSEYTLTAKETIKLTWRCYIPTIAVGAGALGCIIASSILSAKEIASLTGAYGLVRESYQQYRDKVKDLYGEETHDRIMKELAVEKAKDVSITGLGGFENCSLDIGESSVEGKRLFYDSYSRRKFEASLADVIEAEYHLNRNYSLKGCVTVAEFYEFLGLKPLDGCDKVGWVGEDGLYWIDFNHNLVTLDDGLEFVVIDMAFIPDHIDEYC